MSVFFIAALAACLPAANWLIANLGTVCIPSGPCLVPVGFGLMAPSGVLIIGVALVLRDIVHERAGRGAAALAIFAGAGLSLAVAPAAFAFASIAAWVISEIADLASYDLARKIGKAFAVLASGVVGAIVDTALFSLLAFGSLTWQPGLLLGKLYASLGYAAWLGWRRQ